jgi:hypothetical protein
MERVLFTLKWIALAWLGLVLVQLGISISSHTNQPALAVFVAHGTSPSGIFAPFSPTTFPSISWIGIAMLSIVFVVLLFLIHVELLPREILRPVLKLLESMGFEIQHKRGRLAVYKPERETSFPKVRRVTVEVQGNVLSSLKSCIVHIFLNMEQWPDDNLNKIAADQGFAIVYDDMDSSSARTPKSLETIIDIRRVHAKSLNLRLLLKALA